MIHYAEKVSKATKVVGNIETYAFFHPEADISKERYEPTGRYLVVLLHPHTGLQTFYLNREKGGSRFVMDENSAAIIEDEWLDWCNTQLDGLSLKTQKNSL